jgi:hypothetical protein
MSIMPMTSAGAGMSTWKKLTLIAVGYVLSVVGGMAAVILNELLMPVDVAQGSSGMVAFGDMILFVLVTGFFSLVPTLFLLKLFVKKAPRILLAVVLLIAAMGPVSWLAVRHLARADASIPFVPEAVAELLGAFIAFAAFPRMIFGPILLVIEAAIFLLLRGLFARALLGMAMLMDLVPLGMFALNVGRGILTSDAS